jgi:Holliday junction resolvase RusA-like endonuclease
MSGRSFRFVVPGRPVPLARARIVQRILPNGKRFTRGITPGKSKAYRDVIQLCANVALSAVPFATRWPLRATFPVALSLWIYWADENHADGDNLFKEFADSLNALLYVDDKQIVEGHFWSVVDRERPRVEVLIEEREAR